MNSTDVLFPLGMGPVLMILIEFINKKVPYRRVRYLVALGMCLVFGFLLNANNLSFATVPEILSSFGLISTSATTIYQLLYKDSHLQAKIRNTN